MKENEVQGHNRYLLTDLGEETDNFTGEILKALEIERTGFSFSGERLKKRSERESKELAIIANW